MKHEPHIRLVSSKPRPLLAFVRPSDFEMGILRVMYRKGKIPFDPDEVLW